MNGRKKSVSRIKSGGRITAGAMPKKRARSGKMTKAQLRKHLLTMPGGWTNEWEKYPKKLRMERVVATEYPVTLEDRWAILQHHRKELVEPLLGRMGIKVYIDKPSFIQQQEAYDGEKTDVLYVYKVPAEAQRDAKKNTMRASPGDWDYITWLRVRYGDQKVDDYIRAENLALEKTFGIPAVRDAREGQMEWYEEWDRFDVGIQVLNMWARENMPEDEW